MCTKKAINDPTWGILLFLFLINSGFFMTIWAIGVSQPSNHNFVHTLSYMMAHSEELQTLYIIWWSVYTLTNIYILYIVLYYDIEEVKNEDTEEIRKRSCCNYCHSCTIKNKGKLYMAATGLYIPFLGIKLLGLFCLWAFPVNEDGDSHFVFTASAIIASIIVSISLFLRRLTIRTYICIHPSVLWVLIFNFICILGSVTLSIIFVIFQTGAIEFSLAICIDLDQIYQIIDYTWNLECEHTQKKWITMTEHKIQPLIQKKEEVSLLSEEFKTPEFELITKDERVYKR